jgi:hypothetical protein
MLSGSGTLLGSGFVGRSRNMPGTLTACAGLTFPGGPADACHPPERPHHPSGPRRDRPLAGEFRRPGKPLRRVYRDHPQVDVSAAPPVARTARRGRTGCPGRRVRRSVPSSAPCAAPPAFRSTTSPLSSRWNCPVFVGQSHSSRWWAMADVVQWGMTRPAPTPLAEQIMPECARPVCTGRQHAEGSCRDGTAVHSAIDRCVASVLRAHQGRWLAPGVAVRSPGLVPC